MQLFHTTQGSETRWETLDRAQSLVFNILRDSKEHRIEQAFPN